MLILQSHQEENSQLKPGQGHWNPQAYIVTFTSCDVRTLAPILVYPILDAPLVPNPDDYQSCARITFVCWNQYSVLICQDVAVLCNSIHSRT